MGELFSISVDIMVNKVGEKGPERKEIYSLSEQDFHE
jgi:hypothetical protein